MPTSAKFIRTLTASQCFIWGIGRGDCHRNYDVIVVCVMVMQVIIIQYNGVLAFWICGNMINYDAIIPFPR